MTGTKSERSEKSTAFRYLNQVLTALFAGRSKAGASRFEVRLRTGTRMDYLEGDLVLFDVTDPEGIDPQPIAKVTITTWTSGMDMISIEPHPDAPWSRVKLLDEVLLRVFPQAG